MSPLSSSAPSVAISNAAMTATVYLPDPTSGFYRGTRFDWAGVIGRLECGGHTFYAPWFSKTDPAVHDFVDDGADITAGPQSAATGPVEEFSVLGFEEAAPGAAFVKIGVGALRKPDDGAPYSQFRGYDIMDGGERTQSLHPDRIDFTHQLVDTASGFGYHYTKTLRLPAGRAELIIDHQLLNRGTQPIVGTVYNHNFLVFDGQRPGPGLVISAPFDLRPATPLDPARAIVTAREFQYTAPVPVRESVSARFEGFGSTPADYRFQLEHRTAGAGVEIVGDRPLCRLALWSIRTVVSLEPFVALAIAPGATYTWQCAYRYYAIPE